MAAEMNPKGAKDPGNLKEYSPWFMQYQVIEQAQFEIPGEDKIQEYYWMKRPEKLLDRI